jgi:hypothetical protein
VSVKGIVKGLAGALLRIVDSDHDGKLELSDLPGTLAGLASMQAQGQALMAAVAATVDGFRALAKSGGLSSGGVPITAEMVDAALDRAGVQFTQAADESRATLAKG